jgi:hypothetical protein
MADTSERWNATIDRMRELLLQFSPRKAADRRAIAELLECLGALNEIQWATIQKSEASPGIQTRRRRHRITEPAHRYVVEQTPRGNFLAEYRGPDQQPFRVPEDAYNSAAATMAEIREPTSFEKILHRFRDKAGEDLADYLLRTCLRLWTSHESHLVRHIRRQYTPTRRSTFVRDAHKVWAGLTSQDE